MKRVIALFTDPRFLSLLGLVALSLAVWFGGVYIHIGDAKEPLSAVARLTIILVLLLLWGLNNWRIQAQKTKQNSQMMGALGAAVEAEKSVAANVGNDEAKILQARFKEAVDTLKNHRFGDKSKWRTLYELPWYIVIGPPGAGKTTVLLNSGLQFPLKEKFGLQSIGGVGGTRNCDWWFTDDAVLIDTAGRYTTQDSDREGDKGAWHSFLALLKKHRPRRAINGAIVAVSLQELLLLSSVERQRHAEALRNRIQELMSELKVKFPIYFLITKCDLIAGFNEFFEYLDQSERAQVWGVTFPFVESLVGQPGTQNTDFFGAEFDSLVKRINDRLLWRLHQERDPYRRAKISGFAAQFESLRETLSDFVNQVFGGNQYQTPPLLRGVYFTSGTQEGSPIDRILTTLSANYGVTGKTLAPTPGQGKSFFIQRLLKDVIFPEAEIVGVNTKYEGKLRWVRIGAMAATLVLVLAVVIAWTSSLQQNQTLMSEVSALITQHQQALLASQERPNGPSADLGGDSSGAAQVLAIIDPLQQATQVYGSLSVPWLTSMGLYDASVQEAAVEAYHAALKTYFNPLLAKRLERYLSTSTDNDALYDALRVYLMLGNNKRLETKEVVDWFLRDWAETLKNQAGKQKQLYVYLEQSLANGIPEFMANEAIVQRARVLLQRIPIEQRIYKQIERLPEFAQATDFVQAVGGEVLSVFSIKNASQAMVVPFMFTKAGYDQMDLSKSSPLIRKYSTEQWILGTTHTEDFSDKDIEDIAKKVKQIYLLKYAERWKALLNQLAVRDFGTATQAKDALAKISDKAVSPLALILALVSNETTLTPELNLLPGKEGGVAQAVTAVTEKALPPTLVDNDFKTLQQLVRQNKIAEILATTKALHEVLEGFSFAPNPQEAALKFAGKRFAGASAEPIRTLRIQAGQLPQPVRRWLEDLADQSWKVVLVDAKQHLNTLWQTTVHQRYQLSIGSRYPFQKTAQEDVAMLDFTDYFKPGGVEDSFVSEQLAPFINKGKRWTEQSMDGRSIGIGSKTLEALQNAEEIRSVFFRKDAAAPGFDYKLKPSRMDSTVRSFELALGSDRVLYSHGPKLPKSLTWPGASGDGVSLAFEDINETKHSTSYVGDWAFFKALDEAVVSKTAQSNVFSVSFNIKGRKADYELTATSALNPFAPGWLNQYQCPKGL